MNRSHRLPRRRILRKQYDFRELFKKGKRWRGTVMRIYYLEAEENQVAFMIPKRYGNAVKRNRMKRLMREVYRIHGFEIPTMRLIMMAINPPKPDHYRIVEQDFQKFIGMMKGDSHV